MAKFRKKPIVIEAFQLTYDVAKGKESIPEWAAYDEKEGKIKVQFTDKIHNSQHALISTLEGEMRANANDWIIQGVNGEIYPCKPDIFEKTYEKVDEQNSAPEVLSISFGEAVAAAKKGMAIYREGWNGSGMFAYIVPENKDEPKTKIAEEYFGAGNKIPHRAYWVLKTAQNDISTWAPSGSDTLAEDWHIIDKIHQLKEN